VVKLVVNGKAVDVDADDDSPLLWALRDKSITTIEGLAVPAARPGHPSDVGALHAVQAAWLAENVPQCGYCQAGQIMSTVALLRANPTPTDADIDSVLSANLCRCGTYPRIRRAVHRAAEALRR